MFVFLIQQIFPLLSANNVIPPILERTPIHTRFWCIQVITEYGRVSAGPKETTSRHAIYVSYPLNFWPIVEKFFCGGSDLAVPSYSVANNIYFSIVGTFLIVNGRSFNGLYFSIAIHINKERNFMAFPTFWHSLKLVQMMSVMFSYQLKLSSFLNIWPIESIMVILTLNA